jgi:hypothetical protein
MPEKVIRLWQGERDEWLRKHGIDPSAPDREALVARLAPALATELRRLLSDRWNDHLDDCHGVCPSSSRAITNRRR